MPILSQRSPGVLCTDRRYPLDDPPDVVWRSLESVDAYQRWWPWLRHLDAEALAPGERWQARIRVPMPWSLRFTIHIRAVVRSEQVDATLTGDIEGRATVTLAPAGTGASIRLRSHLAPRHRLLRALHRLAPPVSRRLHDRMVDKAFRQFAERPDTGASDSPG